MVTFQIHLMFAECMPVSVCMINMSQQLNPYSCHMQGVYGVTILQTSHMKAREETACSKPEAGGSFPGVCFDVCFFMNKQGLVQPKLASDSTVWLKRALNLHPRSSTSWYQDYKHAPPHLGLPEFWENSGLSSGDKPRFKSP